MWRTKNVGAKEGNTMMFRDLSLVEETEFRQWARKNYAPGEPIKGIWHLIIQEECVLINREHATFVER
jgi:hypothetical protein